MSCQLHGCCKKTPESWLYTKGFITHNNRSSQNVSISTGSPSPSFNTMTWKASNDACTHSGFHYRRGTLGLGNPILNSKQAYCQIPQKEILSLYIFHGYKHIFPLLLMTVPPFSKTVHFVNNSEKITWNKGSQGLYS